MKTTNNNKVQKVQNKKPSPSVVDDDFKSDDSINETPESENWETGDVGEFELVNLKNEGDSWIGYIVKDCESDGLPDWLPQPDKWDDKLYETINSEGQKGLIPKYHRIKQYVEKYGMGKGIKYKITRGKKSGEEQGAFVNFDVKFQKK